MTYLDDFFCPICFKIKTDLLIEGTCIMDQAGKEDRKCIVFNIKNDYRRLTKDEK